MSWEAVEEAIGSAKAIAFDGCHKIYLAMDDNQVAQFKLYGYDQDDSQLLRVTDPGAALATLHVWFEDSCGLRFISAVRTVEGDENEGFTRLIEQFEFDEEDEEEEEVVDE